MAKRCIRVLVVDDSALMREYLCEIIDTTEGLEVAGIAQNGEEAVEKVKDLNPDLVTLDVQMPRMGGIEALSAILEINPIPVIMVSAITQRATDTTLEALERGALDYVSKPENIDAMGETFRTEFIQKIKNMAGADVRRVLKVRKLRSSRPVNRGASCKYRNSSQSDYPAGYDDSCIAIGISTGGPPALTEIFRELEPPLPPIVVVQHMPEKFTGPFAQRLNSLSKLNIKEAANGDTLKPNHALIAPGGKHMHFRRKGVNVVARITDEMPVSGHKPSVDVMMKDIASIYRERCIGVVMTGMGYDGANGCSEVQAEGGYVFGQNEATSDVYGMNKVAFKRGNVDQQFSLLDFPKLIAMKCTNMFLRESIKTR